MITETATGLGYTVTVADFVVGGACIPWPVMA